jgi:ABC-type transport system involved in multi-copper enzyme maturation permease subunit
VRAIWSIACMDLLLWRRMPMAILSAIVPPLTMAAFLVVLSLAVTQQPVALVIEGKGPMTKMMEETLQADDDAYMLTCTDANRAQKLLNNQEVAAVITVPRDFDEKFERSQPAQIKLLLNNVDIDFADDIRRSVDRSVYRFNLQRNKAPGTEELAAIRKMEGKETAGLEARELELLRRLSSGENPYLIKIDEHDLRSTNVQWLNYQVIPALVLLVLNVGLVGTALLTAQDIERKTALHLLLAPQNSLKIIAGKLTGGFLACLIALAPALLLCVVSGTVSAPVGHWAPLLAIFAATGLFSSAVGAIIGASMTGARTIAMAACIVASYLFLLGGGFTTIAFLPDWLRILSSLVPSRYAIDGMRQCLFYSNLDGVANDLLVLCTSALACCLIASMIMRRTWLSSGN